MSASKFQIMVQHLVYNQILNQQMQYFLHLVAQSSSVNVSSNHLYQLLYFLFIILRYWHIKCLSKTNFIPWGIVLDWMHLTHLKYIHRGLICTGSLLSDSTSSSFAVHENPLYLRSLATRNRSFFLVSPSIFVLFIYQVYDKEMRLK